MTTQTTPETTTNPNGCDENHCFCDRLDEYGDINCVLDNPPKDMSIEGILKRLTDALDEQARQIEAIKSTLERK